LCDHAAANPTYRKPAPYFFETLPAAGHSNFLNSMPLRGRMAPIRAGAVPAATRTTKHPGIRGGTKRPSTKAICRKLSATKLTLRQRPSPRRGQVQLTGRPTSTGRGQAQTAIEQEHIMTNLVKHFASDESGATAIEYGLIAAGISVAIITVVNTLGSQLKSTFTNISTQLATAGK
jgi:pilus assembly protein Flp/PilA